MKDFNTPGSNKSWMDEGFKKYIVEWQLENVRKLLDGELKHYVCSDRTTTHEKYVIEYNHQTKEK
ncbi:hypothetical protein Np231112_140 [Synechococcus phage S-RIM2]|jgi:hypothetical protein|uniref:Uncharacterized protein n=1 Tax=Synechococcus phage S-RIM2 TaxID=687800 RepID=A0A1D7RHS9_9CAUD|nr:hypothetical protein Fa100709_140 [Synechococcus phage S-RIM2]AON99155.1 hypothetical protein LIS111010_140 [Synechococcus phage S-RIM2]AON99584.1 hypothetical protein LIS141013_140 [Synechococcus phage S-RIM2]AOO00012.1 hypothetical protein Np010709_140 [Synechococcus phage S-RIM2]AOO00867.1 hypothetical protein Np041112_140 [Synechococcus phage S-RIM2]